MKHAVPPEQEKNTGAGIDQCERAGKEAYCRAEVDQMLQNAEPRLFGEHMQRGAARIQGFGLAVESEHQHVRGEDEENSDHDRASDDRRGDRAQWVPGFRTERGGTLEADEAEEREYETEPYLVGCYPCEIDLRAIDDARLREQRCDQNEQNQADRRKFDCQSGPHRKLNVLIGEQPRQGDGDDDQHGWGNFEAEKVMEQNIDIIRETAGHSGPGTGIGSEQSPR
jgi:hypothetical protein